MKVEGPGALRTSAMRRSGRGVSGDGTSFASELAKATETKAAASAGPVGGVQALISAQEVDDATTRSRRARKRAGSLLDRLDEIRMALLSGVLPEGVILRLQAEVQTMRDAIDDPALSALLDDIDLRAQVELAKLESLR
ncbi:MAG TPA: flagellar assembly protein FliX [Azospirillaceae bacterium]|nr:flagellar assembly protein FliX [Azospirillaceae bacterium]